jgi:hypothetical protein
MKLGSGKQNTVIDMGKRVVTYGLGHCEGILETFGARGVMSGCLNLNFANHFTSVKGEHVLILPPIGREGLGETKTPGRRISYLCYTPDQVAGYQTRDINVCTIYYQKTQTTSTRVCPNGRVQSKTPY